MRTAIVFGLGVCVGALLLGPSAAQNRPARGLNHVGIVVADYDAAMAFYTEAMGFKEAYTIRRPDGSPLLTYLQLNRDTFVELIPAAPGQQPGITHFGVEVDDIDAAVTRLRQHGMTVADPGLTPANARYVRMRDRDDAEIEIMEFGPGALQRKAIDAWPDAY
jgi:catechol 2,3-dioxygenase-like lactoylglutathione lyase family enzyme